MALRIVYEAARVGMRMRGLTTPILKVDRGPVPHVAYLDGRPVFEPAEDAPDPIPVLFVHGLGSSLATWAPVMPALARAVPAVAPDLPGYGRTPSPPDVPYASLRDHIACVTAFMDTLWPDTPVQLVGQSMGGWIAASVAADRPDRVARLTLVNSAGILTPQVFEQRALFSPRDRRELRRLWRKMWYRLPASYYLFEREYLTATRAPVVRGFLDSVDEPDFLNERLQNITAPTLLVWGLADRLISYASVRAFRAGIADIRYRPIADCGHVPQRERSATFLRYVTPWLQGREPPEPPRPGLEEAIEAAEAQSVTHS